ncbi:MAG: hypothetical protein H8E47_04575 [Anaerolineales bacterium]|nr:hypothetical protein [Anaerolineales bacterium]
MDDPQTLDTLSPFDLALRLIDYSNLERPLAAHIYIASAKGQVPFHPVSMLLLRVYRRERNLSRHETLRILESEDGRELRRRLGFEKRRFPLNRASATSRARSAQSYNWMEIGEVIIDAGAGYQCCLDLIWEAGALRLVDIRADRRDKNPEVQLARGYDDKGYPLCPFGYVMHSNGHDYRRRLTKWRCAKACLKNPERPVPDCDYLNEKYKHGYTTTVGRTHADGTVRLAREMPYGSPAWKKRYNRRNSSESRNSVQERLGLKRLQCMGRREATHRFCWETSWPLSALWFASSERPPCSWRAKPPERANSGRLSMNSTRLSPYPGQGIRPTGSLPPACRPATPPRASDSQSLLPLTDPLRNTSPPAAQNDPSNRPPDLTTLTSGPPTTASATLPSTAHYPCPLSSLTRCESPNVLTFDVCV